MSTYIRAADLGKRLQYLQDLMGSLRQSTVETLTSGGRITGGGAVDARYHAVSNEYIEQTVTLQLAHITAIQGEIQELSDDTQAGVRPHAFTNRDVPAWPLNPAPADYYPITEVVNRSKKNQIYGTDVSSEVASLSDPFISHDHHCAFIPYEHKPPRGRLTRSANNLAWDATRTPRAKGTGRRGNRHVDQDTEEDLAFNDELYNLGVEPGMAKRDTPTKNKFSTAPNTPQAPARSAYTTPYTPGTQGSFSASPFMPKGQANKFDRLKTNGTSSTCCTAQRKARGEPASPRQLGTIIWYQTTPQYMGKTHTRTTWPGAARQPTSWVRAQVSQHTCPADIRPAHSAKPAGSSTRARRTKRPMVTTWTSTSPGK